MRRTELPYPSFLSGHDPVGQTTLVLSIRFADCDPMGVLWHGKYLDYFGEARDQLGRSLGFDLALLVDRGWFAPVVRFQVRNLAPARPLQSVRVTARLYPTDRARIYHRYAMEADGHCLADGESEQVLTDRHFNLILQQPIELATLMRRPVVA